MDHHLGLGLELAELRLRLIGVSRDSDRFTGRAVELGLLLGLELVGGIPKNSHVLVVSVIMYNTIVS